MYVLTLDLLTIHLSLFLLSLLAMLLLLQKNRPENHTESAHEALNTKQFLALEAHSGK